MRHPLVQVFLIALFLVPSTATLARAESERRSDKKLEAKAHYETAIHEYDLGKYDAAAADFVIAYELVGEPAILYNLAQAYRLGERFEKSAQAYRDFLRQLGAVGNRAEIEGRILEMDERAADQRRQRERRAFERQLEQRKVERNTSLPYNAQPARTDAAPVDATPSAGRGLKILGYTLCGLTGAALGTGIAMSVLASRASGEVERAATASAVFTPALQSTESRGKLYDTLAIVGYSVAGAAAAGAALSIYFGFRAERNAAYDSETPISERRRPARYARTGLVPLVLPSFSSDAGGLVLAGRF